LKQYGFPPTVDSAKSFASGEILYEAIRTMQTLNSTLLALEIQHNTFSTVYGEVHISDFHFSLYNIHITEFAANLIISDIL
jgi:hypothetical protein